MNTFTFTRNKSFRKKRTAEKDLLQTNVLKQIFCKEKVRMTLPKGRHTPDDFLSGSLRFFVGAKSVWIVAHHTLADFLS